MTQANTTVPMATGSSLRQNVQHSSVYRKMQSVFRDTACVFRRSTSVPGKYLLMDQTEMQLNLAQDEFLLSLNGFSNSTVDDHLVPITIARSEQQWENTVSPEFKAAFVAVNGDVEKTRQNAIHELYLREMNLCHDILLMIYIYQRPLLEFGLLSAEESTKMFPNLNQLFEAHFHLVKRLMNLRNENGVYSSGLGQVILEEIEQLCNPYEIYLLNLKESQKVLKKKFECKRFVHFMQSSVVQLFSRKLGLAAFIDSPRSLLMKLSIMFQEILKSTKQQEDQANLATAIQFIGEKIKQLNDKQAYKEFQICAAHFWLGDDVDAFNGSTEIVLRSRVRRKNSRFNRGKPQLILFNRSLVLARRSLLNRAQKHYIIARINTGSEMFFDYGKPKGNLKAELGAINKSHFQKRLKCKSKAISGSNTLLSRRLKRRQSRKPSLTRSASSAIAPGVSVTSRRGSLITTETSTLHLYSLQVKFNICVKFSTVYDLKLWKSKLESFFQLKQCTGSFKGKKTCSDKVQPKRILLSVD